MGVTTTQRPAEQGLLAFFETRETAPVGRFEAWVCAACGYTEWYARALKELFDLANAGRGGARLVDGGAGEGPYR
jgi:hypothetical protein